MPYFMFDILIDFMPDIQTHNAFIQTCRYAYHTQSSRSKMLALLRTHIQIATKNQSMLHKINRIGKKLVTVFNEVPPESVPNSQYWLSFAKTVLSSNDDIDIIFTNFRWWQFCPNRISITKEATQCMFGEGSSFDDILEHRLLNKKAKDYNYTLSLVLNATIADNVNALHKIFNYISTYHTVSMIHTFKTIGATWAIEKLCYRAYDMLMDNMYSFPYRNIRFPNVFGYDLNWLENAQNKGLDVNKINDERYPSLLVCILQQGRSDLIEQAIQKYGSLLDTQECDKALLICKNNEARIRCIKILARYV